MDEMAKVVAPYLSTQKDNADFICDGVDDQVEIQTAINKLSSEGGIIHLLAGKYNISGSIKLKSHCQLEGEGRHSLLFLIDAPKSRLVKDARIGQRKIKLVNASGFRKEMQISLVSERWRIVRKINFIDGNNLILDEELNNSFPIAEEATIWAFFPIIDIKNAENVVIKDLSIDGNRKHQIRYNATYSCPESNTDKRHVENNPIISICKESHNIRVENCNIENSPGQGIFVYGSGGELFFLRNRLANIGDKGIVTCGVPGSGIISENYIDGTGKTEYEVPSNCIWGWGDCINLHPNSGEGWLVTANILKDARRSGIRMTGVTHSVASNNYISGCGDCGIIASVKDENTITGNSLFRNKDGITLAFPYTQFKPSTITGNIVSENRENGIILCGAKYGIIEGNTISRNGEHGIFITDKVYNIPVSEERWPEHPIRRSSPPNRVVVANNMVVGNSQRRNKAYSNIKVRGSSEILISGNICDIGQLAKKPKCGLDIDKNCSRVVVKDNILGK